MIPVTELLFYCLPAVITGLIAYYFFNQFVRNENARRRFLLQREYSKDLVPIRLQAYERMVLFLERIDPSRLLLRVAPAEDRKEAYEALLIRHIEEEYDHNISQQIYISEECWSVIRTAKNATIQLIRKTGRNTWKISGLAPLYDVEEELDIPDNDSDEVSTFGGLVTSKFGRIPDEGEVLTFRNLNVRILKADEKLVHLTRVQKLGKLPAENDLQG